MQRFLSHEMLARDSRFTRSPARNQLIRSLPDDVDAIVAVFERIAPKIRERVRGTPLEAAYDELGPGFAFLGSSEGARAAGERTPLQLRMQLHGIYVGELQALEAAGRTLWDFPDAPWEFKLNMARQCWDEARHVQVYEKLIERAGGAVGEFPESTFLFETSCVDDPVLRVTGVNRCLEGLACDAFRSLIDFAREQGDEVMAQAIDYVLADEITHVRFGSEWVKQFTAGDPERLARARDFQRETDRRFTAGPRQIARDDRREAGFSEEELAELDAINAEGPRRETLLRAAEILRDRHQARLRGENLA